MAVHATIHDFRAGTKAWIPAFAGMERGAFFVRSVALSTAFDWRGVRRSWEHAEEIDPQGKASAEAIFNTSPAPVARNVPRAGGANPLRAHWLSVLCEKMQACARTPAVPGGGYRRASGTPFPDEHLYALFE
jgi:hypothetical protein